MIGIKYLLSRIKDVKLSDYFSVFPMAIALVIKPFYNKRYNGSWLVCEEPLEARDNGYHFFKYMCEQKPGKKCYYAIKKKSVDYKKVASLGKIIEYGSIQHWLAYFLCEYNISSQKGGKPNAAVCAFMELNGKFHPKNVFLQHGIIINDCKWLYSERSNIEMFVTSVVPEHNYIIEKFGYTNGEVVLTGLPRFDALHNISINKNRILIMPTWRYWFNLKSKETKDLTHDFMNSEYLRRWKELLESPELNNMIEKYNLEVIFYPHRNMQRHLKDFKDNLITKAVLASWENYDIQELLKTSEMMITDYSSVFFDMVYMKKPVVFYQFDEAEYRKNQYQEGWFDYHNNRFGNTYDSAADVINELRRIILNDYMPDESFIDEHTRIFKYYDSKNSERIFELLCTPKAK